MHEYIGVLHLFLEWSASRNVKILLITLPAFETYCQNIDTNQLNTTIQTINMICSKYKNCKYINLLFVNDFEAADFYDADHLNEIGAEKLSKLIDKKLKDWEL